MTSIQYQLLLAHLARVPEVRKAALNNPYKNSLFPESLESLTDIWDTLVGFSELSGKAEAQATLALILTDIEDKDTEKIAKLIWAFPEEDLSIDTGMVLLKEAGLDALKRRMAVGLSQAQSKEDINKLVDESKAGLSSGEDEATGDVVNFLDRGQVDKYTQNLSYQPTYLDFFDQVTDGGLVPGEVWVLLGPTGGGKTMISTQIASSLAINEEHVLYMPYEQALGGDVTTRNITQILGIDSTRIRNKKFTQWPEEIQEMYKDVMPRYAPYLHAADMSGKNSGAGRGADAIYDKIKVITERAGSKPKVIILDWLLPLLTQVIQVRHPGMSLDNERLRIYAQVLMNDLERIAGDEGVSIILMHQLNADLSRASVGKRPKATDAQEVRTLSNLASGCIILTNRDPKTNVCRLIVDKNRRGPLLESFLYMNGPRCMFESVDDMEVSRSGQVVKKKEGGFNDDAAW